MPPLLGPPPSAATAALPARAEPAGAGLKGCPLPLRVGVAAEALPPAKPPIPPGPL
jgi:hypothetical protein